MAPATSHSAYQKVTASFTIEGQVMREYVFPNTFIVNYSENYSVKSGSGTFKAIIYNVRYKEPVRHAHVENAEANEQHLMGDETHTSLLTGLTTVVAGYTATQEVSELLNNAEMLFLVHPRKAQPDPLKKLAYYAKFYTNDKHEFTLQSNENFTAFRASAGPFSGTIKSFYEKGYRPKGSDFASGDSVIREYHRTTYTIIVKNGDRQIGSAIKGYLLGGTLHIFDVEKLFSRLGYEKFEYDGESNFWKLTYTDTSPTVMVHGDACFVKELNESVPVKSVSLFYPNLLQGSQIAEKSIQWQAGSDKTAVIHLLSNSPLDCLRTVDYPSLSPHRKAPREGIIRKITPHHMGGNATVESCAAEFQKPREDKEASSNYGIGTDGRIGLYVEEKDRAFTSSNRENDQQAVTIEVANTQEAADRINDPDNDWAVSDDAYFSLIRLCVDICKRNGITELNYTGRIDGNLTRHNMFTETKCPGPYLQSKFPEIEEVVNERLKLYKKYFS
jgi:hypothetical protein